MSNTKKIILGGTVIAVIVLVAIFIVNYDQGTVTETTETEEDKGAGNLIGNVVQLIGLA